MFRKFLTIRNYTIVVIVCVVLALLANTYLAYAYFRNRSPAPPANIEIIGPSTASVNEITVLAVDGTRVAAYAWIVIPGSCEYRAMEGGRVLVLVFHAPGKYSIVLGTNNGSEVELRKHVISVGGPEPGPGPLPPVPPGPEPNPEPEPEPEPDDSWVKWVYNVAIETVASPDRASQSALLAEQFESISAKIAAGGVGTIKEARVELRVATNRALGNDATAWAAFSVKFSEHCTKLEATGGLKTLAQYRRIYDSAAEGLRKVAKEKVAIKETAFQKAHRASRQDHKPLVAVITSATCPPCRKLVSEYLPIAKRGVFSSAHLVMLDRTKDKDAIQKMATKGMKGRIVVPQIQVQRYINGKWWQFSKIGYVNIDSTDHWAESVFSWTPVKAKEVVNE